MRRAPALLVAAAVACLAPWGCRRAEAPAPAVHRHEHHPPHGGTAVVLGDEAYHVELVRDAAAGILQAYVLDGEMENFVRIGQPSIEIRSRAGGSEHVLVLRAVANPATGESVGDTSLFEGRSEWLRTAGDFDAVLVSVSVRGTDYSGVAFNFPRGNDRD